MILDRYGDPAIQYVRERKALGFTDRSLPCDEQENVNGIDRRADLPAWVDDEASKPFAPPWAKR